jgi:hypothetical protein
MLEFSRATLETLEIAIQLSEPVNPLMFSNGRDTPMQWSHSGHTKTSLPLCPGLGLALGYIAVVPAFAHG